MEEHADNLYAFRAVLREIDLELQQIAEQTQEQQVKGMEDDDETENTFFNEVRQTDAALNQLTGDSDEYYVYPPEAEQAEFTDMAEVINSMNSTLIGIDGDGEQPPLVTITRNEEVEYTPLEEPSENPIILPEDNTEE
jgi:hypothetical protein